MESTAVLILAALALVSAVGNILPPTSRTGRVLRAVTTDARALIAALAKGGK